jgi:hypothetical protein
MKSDVFWDVTPCGSCKTRRSSETSVLTTATRRDIPEYGILQLLLNVIVIFQCGLISDTKIGRCFRVRPRPVHFTYR